MAYFGSGSDVNRSVMRSKVRVPVTRQRSDQLSYVPRSFFNILSICNI
jgi:hypothetical protein